MSQYKVVFPQPVNHGFGSGAGTSIMQTSSSLNSYNKYDVWPQYEAVKDIIGNKKVLLPPTQVQLQYNPIAVIMYLKTRRTLIEHDYSQKEFSAAEPTHSQIQHAEEITDYFLNKLLCQKLSNQYKDTQYKTDLSAALTLAKRHVIAGNHVRLLYKLIDFYVEDTEIEALCKHYNSVDVNATLLPVDVHVLDLDFVKKLSVNRQSRKVVEYFFEDSSRHLYCLRTRVGDAIEPFLNLVVSNGPIRVSCTTPRVETFQDYDFGYAVLNIKKIHTL